MSQLPPYELKRATDFLPTNTTASLARLHAKAWGVATGATFGFGLLIATIALVIRGGENVGAHLGLLSVFFPGYSVSIAGGFIGFVYAFVIGYALGRMVGSVYNFAVRNK
jgi:hypothetical protein